MQGGLGATVHAHQSVEMKLYTISVYMHFIKYKTHLRANNETAKLISQSNQDMYVHQQSAPKLKYFSFWTSLQRSVAHSN